MSLLQKEVFSAIASLLRSEKVAEVVKKAYQRVLNNIAQTKPDDKELKKELKEISDELKRLSRAYIQAAAGGLGEETLQEMVENMRALEDNKKQLELRIKFSTSQSKIFVDHPRFRPPWKTTYSDKEIMDEIFSLWTLFSRHAFKPVDKPGRAQEIVSRIIRAFILRVEISGKDIKPILRFDEQLLERPLDDLLLAVLKMEELISLVEELPELMTTYKFGT